MSRGGGRGRGRGGGRGGSSSNGAMQLVSFDLLKDLNSGTLFNNAQSSMFPEMEVPIPQKPLDSEQLELKRRQEYLDMIHNSAFYIRLPPPLPDIQRYSDKYRVNTQPLQSLRDIHTHLDFFPQELQGVLDPSKSKKKRKVRGDVDDLRRLDKLLNVAEDGKGEDGDGKQKGEGADDDKSDADREEEFEEEEEEEELFDDNDYAQTYFDNGEDEEADDDEGDGDVF